jgi:hypothetical protein
VRRVNYLGLCLEEDGGTYSLTRGGEVVRTSGSEQIALAYMELLEEEILQANPDMKRPIDQLRKERAFNDILAVRNEARTRAREKQQRGGGRGGRGGV